MKAAPFFLLALGLLTAAPAAGQATETICGVRFNVPPNRPPVVDTVTKRTLTDSIPCLRTNGTAYTNMRNREYLRSDSQVRRPWPKPPLPPVPLDTTCVAVKMAPESGPSVLVGGTQKLLAVPLDSAGAVRGCPIAWRSGNPPVASVDAVGLARGLAPGFSDIYATAGAAESHVRLEVRAILPPDTTPPPIPPGTWTRVIANVTLTGDVLVAEGESVLFGPNVQVSGNVIVEGRFGMRPGSTLRFLGGNPDAYQGGGLQYVPALASDVGLWVVNAGKLDISCTPKAGMSRSGADPTWLPNDEYWIAPTAVLDFSPRRWTPGQPIPSVSPKVPGAEVVNVTRDCSIEGAPTGHIHIHSTSAQRIEYVQLRHMGVSNKAAKGPVLGRYALHFHVAGEGSRGSIIRGVACIQCPGRVFVPHSSSGITMIDNVSVESDGEALWWDTGDMTNDLTIDRVVALGVEVPDSLSGQQSGTAAYELGAGVNMKITNAVAAGVRGNQFAICYNWPEPTALFGVNPKLVWIFDDDIGHNCRGPAVRFWTNNQDAHIQNRLRSYHNGIAGVENGAYFSANEYHDLVSFEDGYQVGNGVSDAACFFNNASATISGLGPAHMLQLTNFDCTSLDGPALKIGHRQLPATDRFLIQDGTFTAHGDGIDEGTGLNPWPKVWVPAGVNPWLAWFVRTNVLPEDIIFEPGNDGSSVWFDTLDGRKLELRIVNGLRVVTTRP